MGGSSSKYNESSGGRGSVPYQSSRFQHGASPASLRFRAIADKFTSIDQVQSELRKEGLESSNLIVAIDFTKSNEWTGKHSFQGRSLHSISDRPNPYEAAVSIIGKTLQAFDDDNLIPCYGFGDSKTSDKHVFSFLPGDQPCQGLDQVLWRYRELVPYTRLAGPTSFAPAIQQATQIVAQSGGQYHILLLIADGQVTRGSDIGISSLSPQEQATINAIVEASKFPLSIIMVGVGDGPWDMMKQFDDSLPTRAFDNFQFVNLTEVTGQYRDNPSRMEAIFALRALMEIPEQYKLIKSLGLLGRCPPFRSQASVLPPPQPAQPLSNPYSSYHGHPGQQHPGGYPSAHQQPGMQAPQGFPSAHQPPPPGYPQTQYAGPQQPYASQHQQPPQQHSQNPFAPPPAAAPAVPVAPPARPATSPNPMFLCPITQDVMDDPVVAADGHTYERSAIEDWLRNHNSSPMTNARLASKQLTPNHAVRSAIKEARDRGQL